MVLRPDNVRTRGFDTFLPTQPEEAFRLTEFFGHSALLQGLVQPQVPDVWRDPLIRMPYRVPEQHPRLGGNDILVCAPAIPILERDAIIKMYGHIPGARSHKEPVIHTRDLLTTSQLMRNITESTLSGLPRERVAKDSRIFIDFVGIRSRVVPEEKAPKKYQLFELLPEKEHVVDVRMALLHGISAATGLEPNRKIMRPAPNSNNLAAFAMPIGAVVHAQIKDERKKKEYNTRVNALLERLEKAFFQNGSRSFLLGPLVYNPKRTVLETYDTGR